MATLFATLPKGHCRPRNPLHFLPIRVLSGVCGSLWALLVLLPGLALSVDNDTAASPLGRRVAPFELGDYRGAKHRLEDFQEKPLLVVAFLGTECPLAKLYGPRLAKLAADYADRGVGFVGINSNSQDSLSELGAYARRHSIEFPLLKDVENRVADQMGAVRTPEVFVLDADRTIRYWGRIDDQYGVGYVRREPERHDLQQALDELLDGKAVSTPVTPAPGCFIGRVRRAETESTVTYSNQIARILQRNCVACHRDGEIAPFSLTDYSEVAGWAETIAEVVEDGRMPPWHATSTHLRFANDRSLSADEKQLIRDWVAAGAPQGDPADEPARLSFTDGWQLPREPDLVVGMSDREFDVPAEGALEYQYFTVDPGLTEDRWIKAIEVVPGNRAVVHHILVFDQPPDRTGRDFAGGVRGFLAGYVPGLRSVPYPPGMAKFLRAGSKLVFQLHYTPIGSAQRDLSKIGFVFADPSEIQYEVKTISAFQPNIRIPRNADRHPEVSKTRLAQPAKLLSLMPHMHLRGTAFEYQLYQPEDKTWTTLLDVPNYDFNWQTSYRLAEPLDLPKGSYVKCIAHYDNSADNLNNPDPSQTVGWGEQTWDEMMIGYFDIAVQVDPERRAAGEVQDMGLQRAEEFILQQDKDDDFQLQVGELPLKMRVMAFGADQDRDGVISAAELRDAFSQRRRRRQ